MPLVRRDDDHFASWMAASLVGTAATLVVGPAVVVDSFQFYVVALIFAPAYVLFIAPFWLIGVGTVGVPIWIGLRRLGRDTAFAAVVLGALSAGVTWTAGIFVLAVENDIASDIAKAFAGGAICGGIAGWVGWRFSRRRAPGTTA